MTATETSIPPVVMRGAERLHQSWGWLLVWGILMVVAGSCALASPLVATLASVTVFGVLFLIAGGVQFAGAWSARGWEGILMSVLCGLLYLFAGIVLIERPLLGAAGYTLFLAMLFFGVGVARVASGLIHRFPGWGWVVLSGTVSVLLAIFIWRNMPETALWVIGTFVGIDLIFAGWGWIMLAIGVRRLPRVLQQAGVQ